MQSKIVVNNTDICIRPSSVDTFLGCAYQWARVFLGGETSIPNARAAIGTAIHKGVEEMWREAITTGEKNPNKSMMADAAVEEYAKEEKNAEGTMRYDNGENTNTALAEVVKGVDAFADDVVDFVDIPIAVETRFEMEIVGNPIVAKLGGTVDYLGTNNIADVKTSKRKPTTSNYEIQQSIYKILAEHNGQRVDYNTIQGVVLKKQAEGLILPMATNVDKAKSIVNNLLDTLDVLATDKVRPEVLFRGNPKHYLCSEKYCAFYKDCMFVKGENPEAKTAQVIKL